MIDKTIPLYPINPIGAKQMADITNVPEMLGQSLLAQPEFVQGIIKIMLHWEVYGVLFFVLVGIRMYSGHSRFSSPLAALTALAFLLSVSASLPFAFVVIGLIATCCALLAETTGALLVGSVGAGLDAWHRLNAKKLADEATPSSRQS